MNNSFPGKSFHSYINEENKEYAIDEAIQVLESVLVMIPWRRKTAKEVMELPFFDSVR